MKKIIISIVKLWLRCWNNFGIVGGSAIIARFVIKRVDAIKLPCIEHAIMLRKNTSDIGVFTQIFLKREYDNHLIINVLTSRGDNH